MSKTDKTAPWRVKTLFDPSYLVEVHDHRAGLDHDGNCDLPPRPTGARENAPGWSKRDGTRCHWGYSTEFVCSGLARCGCDFCDGAHYETPRNRRDRRIGKRYARDAWRTEY